jgi:thiosulfate reductase cytochrome b subunit
VFAHGAGGAKIAPRQTRRRIEHMAVIEQSPAVPAAAAPAAARGREVVYRHSAVVRVTHWINALCLALLLMSGLRIFNYHPALYWGNCGYRGLPSFISIGAVESSESDEITGITRIGAWSFVTTGVLGVSADSDGDPWHFALAWLFAANGLVYLMFGLWSGHFRRDLAPAASELRPRRVLAQVWDHVRLRTPRGEAAKRYNVLQKLAYIAVIFVLLPVMVLTGLTMSPAVTAAAPVLFDIFGGRQSARTIHFLAANLLVLFVLVHVVQVVISGAFNGMRSMITGRYVVRPERGA